MEGRKALAWASSFLLCAGCVTNNAHKAPQSISPAAPAAAPHVPQAPPTVATEAKKDPKTGPRLVVALAKFKEAEARTLDREPEKQYKIRFQARDLYRDAIKGDPTNIEAHRGLGRVYVDLGDFERARETFIKAQEQFPKESIFWYELGQMHNRRKDFAHAITCLNKALDMSPENPLYLTTLGFTLARTGRNEESLAVLTRAMGLASAHYNVGRMLLHLQRTDQAVQHLRQAVAANPRLETARQLLNDVENGRRVQVSLEFEPGE
ncbi:MAG: tetratricopeptide repeat protein [Gemmataceae bacterium]|nr:tetratricopeptide repeat protein [Gemmataceae bacterium]